MKMESLERARARATRRLNEHVLDPVVVNSINDIKRLVSEFDPAKNPEAEVISLSTQIEVREGDKTVIYGVTADTKSKSKRDHLLEGMRMIENRQVAEQNLDEMIEAVEINGRLVKPPRLGNAIDGHTWVDPLIKQWLGGLRDGIIIYWDLQDGYRYKYNIFEHKLTRVPREADGESATGSV